MKAIIVGAPIELEGEPAELAQLVELLTGGGVLVEHKHRWRIDSESDGAGVYQARCWCGQERTMQPFAAREALSVTPTAAALAERKKPAGCPNCGADRRSRIHKQRCKAAA